MPIDTRRSLVKKYNPHHGADGRFVSGSGSTAGNRAIAQRGGGTAGAPVKDAFGRPMKQTAAAHSPQAQQAASHIHGLSDGGSGIRKDRVYIPGVTDEFGRTASEVAAAKQTVAAHSPVAQQAASHVHGVPDGGAGKIPIQNPAKPGFQFSEEQKRANYEVMFGKTAAVTPAEQAQQRLRSGPNIITRPDPFAASYATTVRTPKTPETVRSATTVHAPKAATLHAPSQTINEYVNTQNMRRLEGESLKSYVDRRNGLLKLQREREAKILRARANASAPFLKGRPPAFVR